MKTTMKTIPIHFKVCFTGKMYWHRNVMHTQAKMDGQIPVNSVTKNTDILVLADFKSMSIKAYKARRNGTRLLKETDWYGVPWHKSEKEINDYIDVHMFAEVLKDYDD